MWSYNKLWVILVYRGMKKTEFMRASGINTNALTKMGKNEPVAMNALGKICDYLHCNIGDIVEWIPENEGQGVEK